MCILVFSVKHFKWWSCDLVLSRNVSSLLNNDCCYCCCFVSLYITILSSWAIQISTNYSKCKIKLQDCSCSVNSARGSRNSTITLDAFLPHRCLTVRRWKKHRPVIYDARRSINEKSPLEKLHDTADIRSGSSQTSPDAVKKWDIEQPSLREISREKEKYENDALVWSSVFSASSTFIPV